MATNQTQIKNNVYKAIDVIAKERIDSLKLDKTIIGTIEAKISNKDNQYRVSYNGGTLYAYAQVDSVYLPTVTVYVLVPENDFSKKKWIVGRVSNTRNDQNIDVVAGALNQYSIVGNNVITVKDNAELTDALKLRSYEVKKANATFQSANVLYDSKQPQISLLDINAADLLTYVRQSQALSLAADFRTDLSKEQKRMINGNYGLIFNLRFQNKNTSYATMQDKWDTLEPNTVIAAEDAEHQATTDRLNNYEVRVRAALDEDTTVQIIQNNINTIYSDISSFIADIGLSLDNETKSLAEQYLQLLSDLMALTVDQDGSAITREQLIAEYNNWFAGDSDSYVETVESYYLDVDSMVGNPYNLSNYAHQYIIIPIDPDQFIGIDTIYFFCDGFIQNASKADMWGYDLFVKDIEINCLEELDDANDDHRLVLEYPQGTIFRTNDSIDTRVVRAKLLYQNREDLTSFSSFSWFKKDSSITSDDSRYTALAGAGWLKISTDSVTSERTFAASDNKSYENHYKVIATYNMETILVKEFILYNEANHHDIKIVSDNGFSFELSEEDKHLTCLIDDKDITDEYLFSWYIDGELLEKDADWYRAAKAAIVDIDRDSLQLASFYTNKINQLDGISWWDNKLTFPSKQVPSESEVIISCIVTKENYDIGQAEVKLSQGEVRTLKGFHIVIENGSQTFQYNEAGVSPASERYNDPITILPLSCKFYSPGGGLINKLSYTVKWQIPTENTLIVVDKSKLLEGGIDPNGICNFTISDDYNYASVNNQITCIVEFNGDVYTETTDFFFGKIGENGTNGTDVVAKIVPIEEKTNSLLNDELLAIVVADGVAKWNTGAAINTPILELQLYRRNEYIDPSNYRMATWTIAGGTRPLHMSAYASSTGAHGEIGTVDYSIDELPQISGYEYLTNQIVKGQASLTLEGGSYQSYNYFYPIPTIIWRHNVTPYSIGINRTYTMRQVLYNADGRNPAYNKNQGAKLILPEGKRVEWSTIGGVDDNFITSALTIKEVEDDNSFVYVIPADVYSGEYTNNCVEAYIYDENDEIDCKIIIPIHMSLNTYGLASLNAWDGNSITIDEDKGYILSPQIGAGEKHEEDNTFTGVVMGVEQTYEDGKNKNVGLLGYSHGRQSIFLNAENGSATFGLPQEQSDKNDPYTEGRITLVPGGISSIGNWKIGSRFLYNIVNGEISSAYTDLNAQGHVRDIPHDRQGVMLSADPSYISVKGRQLWGPDISKNANRVIEEGDALEIQLDPQQQSLFTIFRHWADKDKEGHIIYDEDGNANWHRSATVGIDKQGRFYSNALRQEATTLAIGFIGAFGKTAFQEKYIGVSVDVNDITTWKLFTDYNNGVTETTPVYLSGATSENNDYQRPIQIMGSSLYLRTSSNDDNSRLSMSTTSILLGQKNAKVNLDNTTATITTSNTFTESVGAKSIINSGTHTQTISGSTSITTANSEIRDSSNLFRIYGKTQGNVIPYDLQLSRNGTNNSSLSVNGHRFILQSNSSQGSSTNDGGTIGVHALNTNYGITLRTTPVSASGVTNYPAGLRLVPSAGSNAFFNLYAEGTAQVNSTNNIGYTFDAYTDNASRSYAASGQTGIYAGNNIGTHGIYVDRGARNIAIATTTIKGSKHGDYQYTADGTSLWDLIYDCLNAAEDARNAARSAHDRANAAYNRADAAYSYADSAYSYADSANSNANNRVDWNSYNNHQHQTQGVDSVSLAGVSASIVYNFDTWTTTPR